jgi:hypothetical protein
MTFGSARNRFFVYFFCLFASLQGHPKSANCGRGEDTFWRQVENQAALYHAPVLQETARAPRTIFSPPFAGTNHEQLEEGVQSLVGLVVVRGWQRRATQLQGNAAHLSSWANRTARRRATWEGRCGWRRRVRQARGGAWAWAGRGAASLHASPSCLSWRCANFLQSIKRKKLVHPHGVVRLAPLRIEPHL